MEGDPGAGHLRLSWTTAPQTTGSELQMAFQPDFADAQMRYRGRHTASVLSGLRDGKRYFRVRTESGQGRSAWSNVETFEVAHHGRALALSLLVAGAFVFAATLGFLLRFARRGGHD